VQALQRSDDDVVFIQGIQQRILGQEALLSPCLASIKTQRLTHALSLLEERRLAVLIDMTRTKVNKR